MGKETEEDIGNAGWEITSKLVIHTIVISEPSVGIDIEVDITGPSTEAGILLDKMTEMEL